VATGLYASRYPGTEPSGGQACPAASLGAAGHA